MIKFAVKNLRAVEDGEVIVPDLIITKPLPPSRPSTALPTSSNVQHTPSWLPWKGHYPASSSVMFTLVLRNSLLCLIKFAIWELLQFSQVLPHCSGTCTRTWSSACPSTSLLHPAPSPSSLPSSPPCSRSPPSTYLPSPLFSPTSPPSTPGVLSGDTEGSGICWPECRGSA